MPRKGHIAKRTVEPDPVFGDSDDGRTLLLDGAEGRGARGVASSIAARFGHPGALRIAAPHQAPITVLAGDVEILAPAELAESSATTQSRSGSESR